MNLSLNLVAHDIIEDERDCTDIYTLTTKHLTAILDGTVIVAKRRGIDRIRLYIDDNRSSILRTYESLSRPEISGVLAIPSDTIGLPGHCTVDELASLHRIGWNIVPHGASHAALAIYHGDTLQPTPPGGTYRNMPRGSDVVLSEAEVQYQLIESKRALSTFRPTEFVLPYGLYNDATVEINARTAHYHSLVTCDAFLDANETLRPRLLLTNSASVGETLKCLTSLERRQNIGTSP